jgi:hypothetical protein
MGTRAATRDAGVGSPLAKSAEGDKGAPQRLRARDGSTKRPFDFPILVTCEPAQAISVTLDASVAVVCGGRFGEQDGVTVCTLASTEDLLHDLRKVSESLRTIANER